MSAQAHALRLGDIAPVESELTIGGMGRRGLEYIFDNQSPLCAPVHRQHPAAAGIQGARHSQAAASLYGGAAGFTLFNGLSLKTVYITGEDDPALAANIGCQPVVQPESEKATYWLYRSIQLWKERLTLTAEYAKSHFDADITAADGRNRRSGFPPQRQPEAWDFWISKPATRTSAPPSTPLPSHFP